MVVSLGWRGEGEWEGEGEGEGGSRVVGRRVGLVKLSRRGFPGWMEVIKRWTRLLVLVGFIPFVPPPRNKNILTASASERDNKTVTTFSSNITPIPT